MKFPDGEQNGVMLIDHLDGQDSEWEMNPAILEVRNGCAAIVLSNLSDFAVEILRNTVLGKAKWTVE